MTITLNYQDNEIVSSPTVIISGRTSTGITQGIVQVVNNDNRVFPPQCFEVNNGNFKALIHVSPNEKNKLKIEIMDNGHMNPFGFPEYSHGKPQVVDKSELNINFNPLPQNKPVHLCVLVGKDSQGSYDMPHYRLKRGEQANLQTAIKKLKVGGRLMQSFTQDDMRSTGMSNRSFQFVEETVSNQGIFGYTVDSPTPHQEIKIHVLRSPKTVAELRDPNLAQQNSKGNNTGGLFSHALELIEKTPELSDKFKRLKTAIQCAVLYLDSHFDTKLNMILTHAALGGGNSNIKLAIFGSHGLHSWPASFPQLTPSFLDGTHLSINEVANDCNQCGTSWECLNITLGAFMHEIGHLLGCPHQVDGVMLRDYIWWNRSFMSREVECLRTKSRGQLINTNGIWPLVCHWNRLDLIRFFYHDSFSLPVDAKDPTYGKVQSTTMIPDDNYEGSYRTPTLYNTPSGGALIKSGSGIYLIEFITKDLARHSFSYYPKSYGGTGLQHEIMLDYNSCYQSLKKNTNEVDEHFAVRILSLGGDLYINDFKKHCSTDAAQNVIKSDFGLNRGMLTGYKSALLGKSKDKEQVIGFDITQVTKVRAYHGGALDGVRFYFNYSDNGETKNAPKVPLRNYLHKLTNKLSGSSDNRNSSQGVNPKVVTIGHEKSHYSDYDIGPGEYITKFHIRNGAWIDAIQIETNTGKKSPMFGNPNGGHLSTLESPGQGFHVIGMYGYVGSWLDGLGIIYTCD